MQDSVEPRDAEGRLVQLNGRKSEPDDVVCPFYSGIGRLVAHSGAVVIPFGHGGLEHVLCAKDSNYKLFASSLRCDSQTHVICSIICRDVDGWRACISSPSV